MKDKLKPCPFCGYKEIIKSKITVYTYNQPNEIKVASCNNCGASAPIKTWDTRPENNLKKKIKDRIEELDKERLVFRRDKNWTMYHDCVAKLDSLYWVLEQIEGERK